MANSFFYLQADKTDDNHAFIDSIEAWCTQNKTEGYIIDRPLGDSKYSYNHVGAIAVLIPKRKISFIDFSGDEESFDSFVEDFIEDLGSISDKYRYKDAIGRPRKWRDEVSVTIADGGNLELQSFLDQTRLEDPAKQRIAELIISLLTGSINDIDRVKADLPESLLDKIKQKILLFDGDQTRFVYQKLDKSPIRIQGLSGTGKTELLMHKLKELYIDRPDSKIAITCHNRILADSLRKRIPDFFDFMKVEQQIQWNERLWCTHAWGSYGNKDSGIYRYICNFYGVPFQRYSPGTTFAKVCSDALALIKGMKDKTHAFDYVLIDESQDFPESFFDLCSEVTGEVVFIAGDIFQSIFDESVNPSISPDFLLSKCYRTDPRTLMFAHSLGMGLFEPQKLRWLEDDEWKACGYLVDKNSKPGTYFLTREPLRRFEDIAKEGFNSVEIYPTPAPFTRSAVQAVVDIIRKVCQQNPTATPDDIGVILLDNNNTTYAIADTLQQVVPREIGWEINKAHESKQRVKDTLFVSNRNNVKGLEFPFVICITEQMGRTYSYRNALYMTITRSFLQSYLVISAERNNEILPAISAGYEVIKARGGIEISPPTPEEKAKIKTTIKYSNTNMSFYDFANGIFDDMKVLPLFRPDLLEAVKKTVGEDFDRDNVKEVAEFIYGKMTRGTD